MFVPDAASILTERLPANAPVRDQAADLRAHLVEDLEQEADVGYIGDVLDAADALDQKRGGQDAHRGVFGPGDHDLAVEGLAAVDHVLDHVRLLLRLKKSTGKKRT